MSSKWDTVWCFASRGISAEYKDSVFQIWLIQVEFLGTFNSGNSDATLGKDHYGYSLKVMLKK